MNEEVVVLAIKGLVASNVALMGLAGKLLLSRRSNGKGADSKNGNGKILPHQCIQGERIAKIETRVDGNKDIICGVRADLKGLVDHIMELTNQIARMDATIDRFLQ